MEPLANEEKNQKVVKVFSWILIVLSTLVLLRNLFLSQAYSSAIIIQSTTRKFDPPLGVNFTLYFIQHAVEFLLCIVVFVSATFVLKYKNLWRNVLLYGLIISIIFLMISPIINYYNIPGYVESIGGGGYINVSRTSILIKSFAWSIIISAFFIVVILKLSKEEVKLLFR